MKAALKIIGAVLVVALSLVLTVIGQSHVGWSWLGLEMVALCAILVVLYLYNRANR